jgi:hypothetical protein
VLKTSLSDAEPFARRMLRATDAARLHTMLDRLNA